MTRNNSDYWNDRKQQFSASLAKDEKRLFSKLAAYYEREAAALEKQIAAYYTQYGEGNVLAYRQLLQTLDAAEVQLLMEDCNAFAEKYPEYADFLPVRESIYKLNRLEGLQTSILLQQLEIGAVEQEQLTAFFLKQAARYANFSAELLGFGEQFYRIDSDMVKKVVGNRWCEGKNFSERIWDNRQKLARTLQTEVVNGIIRGENYHTLANNLRQKFTGVSKKQAERLVYTEDTYLSCEAAITPFEKDPSFTQYRFACTMDGSECDICRALSGQTFSIKERAPGTNFPPMHPWCRCFFDIVVPDLETMRRNEKKSAENHSNSDAILLTDRQDSGIIRDNRIVEAIASGKISLTLNPEKQNPHILGSPDYDPTKNKSYFIISIEEIQEIVNRYYGTGTVIVKSDGQIKETLILNREVGIDMDEQGTVSGTTNKVTIHYSKKRTHVVPCEREKENEN